MLCGTRAISARSVGICDGVPSTAQSSFVINDSYVFCTSDEAGMTEMNMCQAGLAVSINLPLGFKY